MGYATSFVSSAVFSRVSSITLHLSSLASAPVVKFLDDNCIRTYPNELCSYHRVDLASNCRLEYEDRNLRKEKKELAAYEAVTKSKRNDRTE